MNQPIQFLTVLLVALIAAPAAVSAEEKQAPPWFDVEVIAFSRDVESAGGSELWPADPGTPYMDGAWYLQPWGAGNGGRGYSQLPESQWQMKPEAHSIRQGRRLDPLIHVAWRQPVLSPRSAHPVVLRSAKRNSADQPLLQGVIKVSINRYLHVDLDLLLQGAPKQPGENGGFFPGRFQTYRFQAHRRMRSGEIHYIDHPLMGVLILINRFEAPEPMPENVETASETNQDNGSAVEDQQTAPPQPAN